MKREALAIIMVVIVALAFVAGFGAGRLSPASGTILTTQPSSNADSGSTTTNVTTCHVTAEGDMILTVLNSSNRKPISSVPVQIAYLPVVCPPNPHTVTSLGTMTTNGTGTVVICCEMGDYYLRVDYFGSYPVNASMGIEKATCITLEIPSGDLNITHSQEFHSSC